jgi:hypothetical protein
VSWHLTGSYVEACNCEPICPCRRIDGESGGRSTHGICLGVMSWLIEHGEIDGVDVGSLPVVIAMRFDDDETCSPWRWILYVPEEADKLQRTALAAVFSGGLGGDALVHFPWAWKPSEPLGVRPAALEVDHTPRRQRLRVRDWVELRVRDRWAGDETVTSVISGHERHGEELVAERLVVAEDGIEVDVQGVCGYAARFAYAG